MRYVLTGMLALAVCGCLRHGNDDLLHARIRQQQEEIALAEQKSAQSMAELQRLRRETDSLRAELEKRQSGVLAAEHSEAVARIAKLQIHSMLSGGVNKDDDPGDDAFVAHLAPMDDDGEVVKYPGRIDLTLFDPALPEDERQIGAWQFSSDECRSRWTRGFSGAGYQFTVPFEIPVRHESLVLHARMTTKDGRQFDANQICRVTPSRDIGTGLHRPALLDKPGQLDDINDPPPPAGDSSLSRLSNNDSENSLNSIPPIPPADDEAATPKPRKAEGDLPDWAKQDLKPGTATASPPRSRPVPKEPLRDSTNWTEATIPQLR